MINELTALSVRQLTEETEKLYADINVLIDKIDDIKAIIAKAISRGHTGCVIISIACDNSRLNFRYIFEEMKMNPQEYTIKQRLLNEFGDEFTFDIWRFDNKSHINAYWGKSCVNSCNIV